MIVQGLYESLQVFYLLRTDFTNAKDIILECSDRRAVKLATRTIFIDLVSFMDELDHFVGGLYKNPDINASEANRFLVLSHSARKVLNRNNDIVRKYRNTIQAHNFRNKLQRFTDPWQFLMQHYQESPVTDVEVLNLAQLALLIISLAFESFPKNDNLAYSLLNDNWFEFSRIYPGFRRKEIPEIDSFERIAKDLYHDKDWLQSDPGNIRQLADRINCRLVDRR